VNFEWDDGKAAGNLRKHGVGFDEGATVFHDMRSLAIEDDEHSLDEERFREIGVSSRGRVLVVTYCYRGENEEIIRIITVRRAMKSEIRDYDQRKT
jgi:uncharacterized protein